MPKQQFIVTAMREWNNLQNDVRYLPTRTSFKHNFKKNKRHTSNNYFSSLIKLQVLQTRLRTKSSSLNYQLFKKYCIVFMSLKPKRKKNCQFFFGSTQFDTARRKLFCKLNNVDIDLNCLLSDNPNLSDQTNTIFCLHIHLYPRDKTINLKLNILLSYFYI
jgi:hypothetical protein